MTGFRKPARVIAALQSELDAAIDMLLSDAGVELPADWHCFVTDTRAGRTRRSHTGQTLTVPLWAYRRGAEYFLYYVAHELSHIFRNADGRTWHHDAGFMEWFRRICPAESQHHEIGYKPRAAQAAGIRKPESKS